MILLTEKILFQKSSLVFSLPSATPPPGLVKDHTFPEIFFSCPEQLNIGDLVTNSLTESLTFTFAIQRAILETCDLWDICSEWWEDMTWPKKIDKDKDNDNDKDKDKGTLRTPPKSNPRDLWPLRHMFRVMRKHDMTKKIDKDKDNDKDKDILRTPPKSNPRDLWPLRHLFRKMRRHDMTKKIWQRQIQRQRQWQWQWQWQRHFKNTS